MKTLLMIVAVAVSLLLAFGRVEAVQQKRFQSQPAPRLYLYYYCPSFYWDPTSRVFYDSPPNNRYGINNDIWDAWKPGEIIPLP